MPDYDLSRLSSRSFEHLVQSLAASILGPGIVVFGDGPDGGREATFERKVPYPTDAESWDGYGVVQAKYRQRPVNTKQDGDWAVDQLKAELQKYTDPGKNLRTPDYFIYATNVVLTPVNTAGSKDRAIAALEEFKEHSSLKDYAIWDYDQIRTFLNGSEDVRNAYRAFITPGDVLAKIIEQLDPTPADMYDTFVMFLERELLSDECVKLEQAGHNVDEPIPLATVFVDLPTRSKPVGFRTQTYNDIDVAIDSGAYPTYADGGFITDVLSVSSALLDPASTDTPLLPNPLDSSLSPASRGRFVLIGGPGQGKTTLTQFLCQIFRSSIIAGRSPHTLSPEVRSALDTIQSHCEAEGIAHSVVPRFPFKLILNDFAKALSSTSARQINSVLGYLSRQVSERTESTVSANDLRRFLAVYPSVFIFDGLDEVPASSNRDQVLDAIKDFWIDASHANADILSIATSRPHGYNEDFSPLNYQHQELAELSDELSRHFAQRLVEVRFRSEEERKKRVLDRLERALSDESTARLMRSPLQVTIMTALVDQVGQPPQAQWNLFSLYYEVIYRREVERSIPASTILRDYQPDIKAIHNQVGLLLQIDSERTGGTDAQLSRSRFVSLVEARLKAEGHQGAQLHTLSQQIVEAASQRLVFLVELESEQIGFEIRSLQEFMAAESLMDGTEANIKERLEEIAPIPFWRNVFLFAAGKCFAVRQDLRDDVHTMCAGLNEAHSDGVTSTYLAGSELAIALLEEASLRRQPKFASLFTRLAMRAVDTANPSLQLRLAEVYEPQQKVIYQEELKLRLNGGDSIKSVGAWNCLINLIAGGVPWAVQMANETWPSSKHRQVKLLKDINESMTSNWIANKVLQLLPTLPSSTFSDMIQLRSFLYREAVPKLAPEQEAAISVVLGIGSRPASEVSVLNTGLYYGPYMRVSGTEESIVQRLQHVDDWHYTWHANMSAPSLNCAKTPTWN